LTGPARRSRHCPGSAAVAAAGTYQALNHGAHGAFAGDPGELVGDTRVLVDKIRASLP
jgi:hypothetical protein